MRKIIVLVGLALLTGLFIGGVVQMQSRQIATVGEPAPDFTLPDLDGNMVSLKDLRGKVVLINVWATWCPPCLEEMPALQQLQSEMKDRVVVLGVDRAEPRETVARFARRYGITFTLLLDKEDRLISSYPVAGLPESFFVDAGGIYRGKYVGAMSLDTMREYVRKTESASAR